MVADVTPQDIDWEAVIHRHREFWETFEEAKIESVKELAAPTIRYRDPMRELAGIDAYIAMLRQLCKAADQIRTQTLGEARDGNRAYVQWIMTFRPRKAPKKLVKLPGMSAFKFDKQGRLLEHFDYWDSAVELAMFPVLGRVVGLTKRLMT